MPFLQIKSLTFPKPTAAVKGTQQTPPVLAYQAELELGRNTLPRCGPAMHKVAMVSPMVNSHGTNNNKRSLEELKKSTDITEQQSQRKDEDEEIDSISPMQPLQPRNAPYGSYLRSPSANQPGSQGAPNQGSSRFIPGGKYHVPSLRLQADPSRVAFARHLLAASRDMARLKHHPPGQGAVGQLGQLGALKDDVGGYLSDGDVLRPGRGGCAVGVLEEIPSGYLSEGGASLYRRRHDVQQHSAQQSPHVGSTHLGANPISQLSIGGTQSGQNGRPNSNHPQGGSTPHKKMDPKLINVLCDDRLVLPNVFKTQQVIYN